LDAPFPDFQECCWRIVEVQDLLRDLF